MNSASTLERVGRRVHVPTRSTVPRAGAPLVRIVALSGSNACFMREVAARRNSKWLSSWRVRRSRVGGSVLLCALLLVLVALIVESDQKPAHAIFENFGPKYGSEWCQYERVPLDTGFPDDSIVEFGKVPDRNGNIANTTWAQYGVAGIDWEPFWLHCSWYSSWTMNGFANTLLQISSLISGLVITLFQWVFQGHIINVFITETDETPVPPLESITKIMDEYLVKEFFALMVIIAAGVLAWRAFIKDSGLADTLGKFLVMVILAALLAIYADKGVRIVKSLNDTTNDVTGLAFATFARAICDATPGQAGKCDVHTSDAGATTVPCPDSLPDQNGNPRAVSVAPVDCIGQTMYHALIFVPWANGLVGSLIPSDNSGNKPLTKGELDAEYSRRLDLAAKVLRLQAYSRTELQNELRAAKNDNERNKIKNAMNGGMQEDCVRGHKHAKQLRDLINVFDKNKNIELWLKMPKSLLGFSAAQNPALQEELRNRPMSDDEFACALTKAAAEDDNENTNWPQVYDNVDPKMQGLFLEYSGKEPLARLQTGAIALIGGLAMAVVLLSISLAYLVLQIATVVLAMIAPLAMLVGLVPVIGFKIFLKWAEIFLGTFLKRIGLGIFVGFLMVLYAVALLLPIEWIGQLAMVLGIALVGLVYRKKLMEVAGVGGVGSKIKAAAGATGKGALVTGAGGARMARYGAHNTRMRLARGRQTYRDLRGKETESGKKVGRFRRSGLAILSGLRGSGGRQGRLYQEKNRARALQAGRRRKRNRKKGIVSRGGSR